MKITKLEKYTPEAADQIRQLLIQLSRSGKDKGEIPQTWLEEIIASPYHDILVALDDNNKIIGVASLSIIIQFRNKKAYLEDFVTDSTVRGQGVGSALWTEVLNWAKEHNCDELDFTSGYDRTAAHQFYKNHDAKIYDTAFFRRAI